MTDPSEIVHQACVSRLVWMGDWTCTWHGHSWKCCSIAQYPPEEAATPLNKIFIEFKGCNSSLFWCLMCQNYLRGRCIFNMMYDQFYISFAPCYRFVLFCPYLPEMSTYHTIKQTMCQFTKLLKLDDPWGLSLNRYDILIVHNFCDKLMVKLYK